LHQETGQGKSSEYDFENESGKSMKDRGKINLTIDLLLLIALAFIAGIGFLIKYTLPPGRENILKYGESTKLLFLGMDRHQWGAIHLIVAYAMIALLVLHLIFHWKAIVSLFRRAVPSLFLRRLLLTGFTILVASLTLFSFLINPEKGGNNDYLYRNSHQNTSLIPILGSEIPKTEKQVEISDGGKKAVELQEKEYRNIKNESYTEKHDEEKHEALLRGKMTIADASRLYGLSIQNVKKLLDISGDISDSETIGRLGRKYGFTMEQARKQLEQSQVNKDEKPMENVD
jgi:hypothetical protein